MKKHEHLELLNLPHPKLTPQDVPLLYGSPSKLGQCLKYETVPNHAPLQKEAQTTGWIQDDSLQDDRCKITNARLQFSRQYYLHDYQLQIKVRRMKRELTSRSFQGPTSYHKVPRLRVSRVE